MRHGSHLNLIRAAIAALLLTAAHATASDYDAGLLELINNYRTERGLGTLVMKQELTTLAREHSRGMKQAARLSHDGFKGRFRKAQRSGNSGCVENVGWNYPTAAAQFEGWQNSPGHDRNMLDPKITGAGIARAGAYVTFFACY